MDILTDKSYRDYDYISRYSNFPYYYNIEDNKYIYGLTSQLKDSIPYILHKVAVNDTYDNISLNYYNSPTFFWIICDFNKIQDPFTNPIPGTYLKIPNISGLSFEV